MLRRGEKAFSFNVDADFTDVVSAPTERRTVRNVTSRP
jgi:hypothetical protein